MSNLKDCPYCGEEILAKAIKCKHCHSMLQDSPQESSKKPGGKKASPPPPPGGARKPNTGGAAPPPPPPAGGSQKSAGGSPVYPGQQGKTPPPPPGTAGKSTAPPPPPSQGGKQQGPPPPPPGPPPGVQGAASPPPPPKMQSSAAPPPPPGGFTSVGSPGSPPPPPPGGSFSQGFDQGQAMQQQLGAYSYPKAELGKRFLAYLIDGVIAMLPMIIFMPLAFLPLYRYMTASAWGAAPEPGIGQWLLIIVGVIIGGGWGLFYTLLRDGFGRGQSIGKKAAGLMVVRLSDNAPCTKKDSFVRNIFAMIISLLLSWIPVLNMLAGMAEPIIGAVHAKGHRVGDRVAKTQVITLNNYQQ